MLAASLVALTIASCSCSAAKCTSAAVNGLGCLRGRVGDSAAEATLVVLGGLEEAGIAAVCEALSGAGKVLSTEPGGKDDGFMAWEARLDVDIGGGLDETESLRGEGGNELRSGAMPAVKAHWYTRRGPAGWCYLRKLVRHFWRLVWRAQTSFEGTFSVLSTSELENLASQPMSLLSWQVSMRRYLIGKRLIRDMLQRGTRQGPRVPLWLRTKQLA